MLTPAPMFDIDQVAARFAVDRDAVSRWIAQGELLAVNVARSRNAKRPSWRIRPEDLETFELSRLTSKPITPTRRAKKPAPCRKWF